MNNALILYKCNSCNIILDSIPYCHKCGKEGEINFSKVDAFELSKLSFLKPTDGLKVLSSFIESSLLARHPTGDWFPLDYKKFLRYCFKINSISYRQIYSTKVVVTAKAFVVYDYRVKERRTHVATKSFDAHCIELDTGWKVLSAPPSTVEKANALFQYPTKVYNQAHSPNGALLSPETLQLNSDRSIRKCRDSIEEVIEIVKGEVLAYNDDLTKQMRAHSKQNLINLSQSGKPVSRQHLQELERDSLRVKSGYEYKINTEVEFTDSVETSTFVPVFDIACSRDGNVFANVQYEFHSSMTSTPLIFNSEDVLDTDYYIALLIALDDDRVSNYDVNLPDGDDYREEFERLYAQCVSRFTTNQDYSDLQIKLDQLTDSVKNRANSIISMPDVKPCSTSKSGYKKTSNRIKSRRGVHPQNQRAIRNALLFICFVLAVWFWFKK